MTTLLQISDCHLSAEIDADYRGRSPDAALEVLAPAVRAFDPDRLVLTGDLSEDGSPESFGRIRDWAVQFGKPVAWIPGNHDDLKVMAPLFDEAGLEAGPVIEVAGWRLVLLDSAWPERPEGELDQARLTPLEDLGDDRPAGVFVHHQPLPVGAAWIDKVPLVNPEILWRRLKGLPVRFVAFGHVHHCFRREFQDTECLACPSTVANSRPATERFDLDPAAPVARWFRLEGNGEWWSGYLSVQLGARG